MDQFFEDEKIGAGVFISPSGLYFLHFDRTIQVACFQDWEIKKIIELLQQSLKNQNGVH